MGVTLPTVGRFSLHNRKLSELWLEHNPEPVVEVCLTHWHKQMPVRRSEPSMSFLLILAFFQ